MSETISVAENTKNPVNIFLVLFVGIYPLLFVWQGLDFTDMGYWLAGYQQFLVSPESINEGMLNWLSYATGFVVESIAGQYIGVIAFKIAFVAVNWLCVFFLYTLLRDCFKENTRKTVLLVSVVTLLYVTKATDNWIGYNNLTALFYLAGATFLYFGLTRESRFLIFLSAFILSANIFVRFPNVLGAGLVVIIGLFALVEHKNMKFVVETTAIFAGGFVFGYLSILFAISVTGHYEFYKNGLTAIFHLAADRDSHHASGRLLSLFFKDHFRALLYGGISILSGLLLSTAIRNFSTLVKWVVVVSGAIFSAMLLIVSDMWKWVITGICYYVLLFSLYVFYKSSSQKFVIASFALLILLMAPLGSSNGMRNSVYGVWLALPSVVLILMNSKYYLPIHPALNKLDTNFLVKFGIVSITLLSLMSAYSYTYRDSKIRASMKHQIDHELLHGVFTTQPRAEVVNELLHEVSSVVGKQDTLLVYNEIPLVHYLTHTKPWLNNPWPMLFTPEKIEGLIKVKEEKNQIPSYVVRATGNTTNRDWPSGTRTFGRQDRKDESRMLLNQFVERHNYKLLWENSYFQVLTLYSLK